MYKYSVSLGYPEDIEERICVSRAQVSSGCEHRWARRCRRATPLQSVADAHATTTLHSRDTNTTPRRANILLVQGRIWKPAASMQHYRKR